MYINIAGITERSLIRELIILLSCAYITQRICLCVTERERGKRRFV